MKHRKFYTEAYWGVIKAFASIPLADAGQWALIKTVSELHDRQWTIDVQPSADLAYNWDELGIEYQRERTS